MERKWRRMNNSFLHNTLGNDFGDFKIENWSSLENQFVVKILFTKFENFGIIWQNENFFDNLAALKNL